MVSLQVQLRSAFKEEVVVSGGAPLIDVRSPEMGSNITAAQIASLPTLRNYAAIVQTAPGTNQDAQGTVVYGSSGAENAYYIDGVNTTEIQLGRQGKDLQPEFIQEVQVKTGSYQAEFGRATGGMINAITKSGGNEFHGDAFGYYDGSSLQNKVSTEHQQFITTGTGSYFDKSFTRKDFGADLGGFVLKDKIWFFGGYDHVDNATDEQVAKDFTPYGGPAQGQIYTATRKRDLWSGKLTWRVTPNHSFIVSAFGDPTTDGGPGTANGHGLAGPETTFMEDVKSGGTDKVARYEGVLGTSVVVNVQAAQHMEKLLEAGGGASIPQIRNQVSDLYANTGTTLFAGGLGYTTQNRFERDDYRGDVMAFLNNFGGDHEFKGGIEYEKVLPTNSTYHSGGDLIWHRCIRGHMGANGCAPGFDYYQHEVYLTARPPGGAADPTIANYLREPFVSGGKSDNTAYYLQDTWRVVPTLTISLGLRNEEQKMYDYHGVATADIKNEWQPRVGMVWDPSGRGSSKVYGSYGYFYETIPTDIIHRAFGQEISTLLANNSTTTIACDPALNAAIKAASGTPGCRIVGGGFEPVDPNLKGQYISEAVLGAEHEFIKDWVFGGKLIYRSLDRVIEDSLGSDQNYYIGNPGMGLLSNSWDQTYTYQFPAPKPKRTFKGVEITATKRFSNNWQFFASYLYSKLEGNYDGTFQASTGQLDPGINSAFDYAEFQIHNEGNLSNDRTHQFRMSGSYRFPFGLNLGFSAYFQSGTPVTAMGYNDLYRNWELYLSDRGAFGRTANEYEANLHLDYPFKFGGVQLTLLMDVFNLLNRQGETGRSLRFTNTDVLDVIDYNTGAVIPAVKGGQKCTDLVSAGNVGGCNTQFNVTNAWQDPRQIRFGVRLTF
jgi:outer membrane receptor protein involved in Fe transport